MAEHNELGKKGEELAVAHLEQNGYLILETNYIFQKAEIDIIAQNNEYVIVVEVKTRTTDVFGLPQEFVKPSKIKLLVKAINEYVEQNQIEKEIRFDIVSVLKQKKGFVVEHLEDAFF